MRLTYPWSICWPSYPEQLNNDNNATREASTAAYLIRCACHRASRTMTFISGSIPERLWHRYNDGATVTAPTRRRYLARPEGKVHIRSLIKLNYKARIIPGMETTTIWSRNVIHLATASLSSALLVARITVSRSTRTEITWSQCRRMAPSAFPVRRHPATAGALSDDAARCQPDRCIAITVCDNAEVGIY